MSDQSLLRRFYYFDAVAALMATLIVIGHLASRSGAASPPVTRDALGFWAPLLAFALLARFRRPAYTQATPYVAGAFAALTGVAVAVLFWRWNVLAFIPVAICASVLLLAGLVLRTRRILEPLTRIDLFGLIAMAVSVALTLALAEAFLRLAPGVFTEEVQQFLRGADPDNFGVAHPYIGHLHTPDSAFAAIGRDFRAVHHVDRLGFRNSWPWPERADVVTVGDSVTFGQNVQDEEAWPYLVGQDLLPRRLVNLGLIGAGPQQYLRVFETFGVKLRPKLLLVGIFARNDFWDAGVFDRWLQSGVDRNYMIWRDFGRPRPVRLSLRQPGQSLKDLVRFRLLPILRHSYILALLRGLRGGVEGGTPAEPRIVRFENGRSLQLLEDDFLAKVADARPGERVFELVLDSLTQIDALASRHRAQALMVLLPGKEEVYLPALGVKSPDPTEALRSALDRLGIEYLNLTPGFRARAAAGEQLFFEVDGHPNRAGQALIAQLVLEHITAHAERYGLVE